MVQDCIGLGEHIVIQRQNYKKLHKLNKGDSTAKLGRDTIRLSGVVGCRNLSFFKLVIKGGSKKNRVFELEPVSEAKDLKESIDIATSGTDNRHIIDDGRSQKLSAAEIEELKNDAGSSSDIVGTLVSNSNTFHSKTEFSQEKYLKKKEKKYFEYIQIRRPNIRLVAEIMYRLDENKVQGLRMDTLSQIVTFSNISSEGTHLLYDSGSNGLLAATLLNAIGANTKGKLIHLHPGNMAQKQALQALNFPQEQLDRCLSANVYSAMRQYYQGCDLNIKGSTDEVQHVTDSRKRHHEDGDEASDSKIPKLETANSEQTGEAAKDNVISENVTSEEGNSTPEENSGNFPEGKKPKWHFDTIAAAEELTAGVDSLIVACKEDPLNIVTDLLQFVRPSRALVVYYPVMEPLLQCYMSLRARSDVAALKLTNNWMRYYQVLPERTHPEVMMNNCSGFLLSGYTLK